MQRSRSIVAIALIGLVAAACGGTSATQGPGGATQNPGDGGQPTENIPGATQGGGGGTKPAGWDQFGKANYEISAPISLSGELGFVPAASIFGGDQQTQLAFSVEDGAVLTVQIIQGVANVSFGSEAGQVIGSNCKTNNLSIQTSSASGSFECTDVLSLLASGAQVTGVTLKGNFNGHG